MKEVVDLAIPEGPRVGVCNVVSVGTDRVTTTSFRFFSCWAYRNSASIFQISVEVVVINSRSLLSSLGNLAILHN